MYETFPMGHLRQFRLRRWLSQGELAALAGVTRVTVFRLEHGHPCRMSTVRKLARALEVEPQALVGPCRTSNSRQIKAVS